ncbi:TOTE conflict system archaeo-eukaryotic primase domain-containing protein [Thomasclavelia saccharogumia]|uniref:TOTE conflict system archaeo-eukaryotic primase domain-containing protein n=1 Tax=Thomasclavelia saccharogumia TaxID=341225 RepID=UPI00068A58ED|nr:DEAD/DEAH box helicase family protein [Thomasclavelia saccharogumia]
MSEQTLLDEIYMLKEENKKLRQLLTKYGYIFEETKLNSADKMKIYRSYFRGRDDIYACFYKQSVFPACYNRTKGNCYYEKGHKVCSKCNNASFVPLTDDVIRNHISKPNQRAGLYPLLKDNTCYLLAIDFDEDDWFDAMLSVYRIAKRNGIDGLMERSKSGNGGHLWIFFENNIYASCARKLGFFLLNEAMKINKRISFDSFDRLFPNQDTMPIGGFGNLIALPMQYDAINNNKNTLFIDEDGKLISNQFIHLANIKKTSSLKVEEICQKNTERVFNNKISAEAAVKFNNEIKVIEGSMLKIYRLNLNALTLNTIKTAASIWNQEYFLFQNMHRPIYHKTTPAILSEYEVLDEYLYLPRGLKKKLLKIFDDKLQIEENTELGHKIEAEFKGKLIEYQEKIINELDKHDLGVVEAPTGSGKTIMALAMIAKYKVSTLIILPGKELLKQWKRQIDIFIKYPQAKLKRDHYIGEYTGNKKKLTGNIDIATIQSLVNIEDFNILQKYGLVIIDECHHCASNTYRTVLKRLNAKRIYGFTATPERQDGLEEITYMYLGKIVAKVNEKDIAKYRDYEQVLIPRFTTFTMLEEKSNFMEIVNILIKNEKRNHLIIMDVIKEFKEKRNIIILSDRVEHLEYLYEQLRYVDEHVYLYLGKTNKKDKANILEELRYTNDFNYIILASAKLIGEGFDLPSLETMFMATPFSWKGRTKQYSGRLHRQNDGKELVRVYDYVDQKVGRLAKIFNIRLKTYLKEGYKILENEELLSLNRYLYSNYIKALESDMLNAREEIIIYSSKLTLSLIKKSYQFIQSLIYDGINVIVIIKSQVLKNTDETAYLERLGVKLIYSEAQINNIIIDNKILWIPNYGYYEKQKNVNALRIEDVDVIEEIISMIKDNV